MERNTAKEEVLRRWEDVILQLPTVQPAKAKLNGRTSYICPLCRHGKGGDGIGLNPKSKSGKSLKCFSCDFSGDIIDLVGAVYSLSDFKDKLAKAGELIGLRIEEPAQAEGSSIASSSSYKSSSSTRSTSSTSSASEIGQKQARSERSTDTHTHMNINTYTYTYTHQEKAPAPDNMPYYRKCNSRLGERSYLQERGISEQTAKRFMLGYDLEYNTYNEEAGKRENWEALIIPTGLYSYQVRNTDLNASKKNRYRKSGNSTPLNYKALWLADKPIFITEGEIDALSIIEVGGEAIGIGGVGVDKFIEEFVKKYKPKHSLILAFDNDDRGAEAQEKMYKGLQALGVNFYATDIYGNYKDANEALVNSREEFTQAVKSAEYYEEELLEAEREEYYKSSSYSHISEFMDGIAESANTPAIPTGFYRLDNTLDGGLYEGLYCIGAVTSLGKTTLALQIVDQLAQAGKDVLVFSLEMARTELMSKSLSRLTLLDVLDHDGNIYHAKTARGITAGARWERYSQTEREIIERSTLKYKEYAKHIFIHEGLADIGVDQVAEIIKKHIYYTGNKPIVLIDYLQILQPPAYISERATDKQRIDGTILELKRLSRDFKLPVLAISSLNREGYKTSNKNYGAISLTDFKESGAIEYTSDVIIGLQLKGAGSKDFNLSEAIKRDPREVELVILKNRNGKTGEIVSFEYYPLFNYFKEI